MGYEIIRLFIIESEISMNDKTLYLECYSGISGDMTVAALLDLGADQKVLLEGLKSLNVEGYQIKIGRRAKNSIDACDFDVILEEPNQEDSNDDSTNEHDHNHTHSPSTILRGKAILKMQPKDVPSHNHAEHDHPHPDHTHHDHSHPDHSHHDHSHSSHTHHDHPDHDTIQFGHHDHRNLAIINDIIDNSSITDNAKKIAKRVFYIVAVAEAKAHGKPMEEVHFHEVGAIDSIVDIVAAAICIDNLNIKNVIVSELYEGTGFITCQHGILPIPVPAVINIAAEHKLPLHITNVQGELVTPTGAAIVAAIRTAEVLPKDVRIKRIGLGAGKRSYAGASGLLRAMLLEETKAATNTTIQDTVWVLEANIDDCPGEVFGYAMDLLLQNGAKDAYYTPIYMKKNRPAYMLGVICSEDKIAQMEEIIFTHTTTIGIRRTEAIRSTLPREIRTITTAYGDAMVKVCHYQNQCFYYPEYESIKKLCEIAGKDYMSIYHLVQSLASEN
jgi:uncharacterized protein (TIGR00299 family) protein